MSNKTEFKEETVNEIIRFSNRYLLYFLLFYFLDTEAGLFLDIIQLQKKKRKNIMKRSYAEQWELECLL